MSVIKTVILTCDGPGCGRSLHEYATATELRRSAHADGWRTYLGGRDLCPACMNTTDKRGPEEPRR